MKPLALTMGEPAGIGGDVTLAAWMARHSHDIPPFFVIDDADRLRSLSKDIPIRSIGSPDEAAAVFNDFLPVLPLSQSVQSEPGKPSVTTAEAVISAIDRAVAFARNGQASGVVTNPIHKGILYDAGFTFPGHTEYLAYLADVPRTVMMLTAQNLRAIPVTVHEPLSQAISKTLTSDLIVETISIAASDISKWFGMPEPRIAVAGLNPHAGEGGALGEEEDSILRPAIQKLIKMGHRIQGPLPADTMFHEEARRQYDVAICMYHDQALIPVKTLDFHGGVNVTLGLPFIRTSPDHGTALGIAGTMTARPDSLIAALKLAASMASQERA